MHYETRVKSTYRFDEFLVCYCSSCQWFWIAESDTCLVSKRECENKKLCISGGGELSAKEELAAQELSLSLDESEWMPHTEHAISSSYNCFINTACCFVA